jgi:hypothetical protein
MFEETIYSTIRADPRGMLALCHMEINPDLFDDPWDQKEVIRKIRTLRRELQDYIKRVDYAEIFAVLHAQPDSTNKDHESCESDDDEPPPLEYQEESKTLRNGNIHLRYRVSPRSMQWTQLD